MWRRLAVRGYRPVKSPYAAVKWPAIAITDGVTQRRPAEPRRPHDRASKRKTDRGKTMRRAGAPVTK
jgi:hypothetical protein